MIIRQTQKASISIKNTQLFKYLFLFIVLSIYDGIYLLFMTKFLYSRKKFNYSGSLVRDWLTIYEKHTLIEAYMLRKYNKEVLTSIIYTYKYNLDFKIKLIIFLNRYTWFVSGDTSLHHVLLDTENIILKEVIENNTKLKYADWRYRYDEMSEMALGKMLGSRFYQWVPTGFISTLSRLDLISLILWNTLVDIAKQKEEDDYLIFKALALNTNDCNLDLGYKILNVQINNISPEISNLNIIPIIDMPCEDYLRKKAINISKAYPLLNEELSGPTLSCLDINKIKCRIEKYYIIESDSLLHSFKNITDEERKFMSRIKLKGDILSVPSAFISIPIWILLISINLSPLAICLPNDLCKNNGIDVTSAMSLATILSGAFIVIIRTILGNDWDYQDLLTGTVPLITIGEDSKWLASFDPTIIMRYLILDNDNNNLENMYTAVSEKFACFSGLQLKGRTILQRVWCGCDMEKCATLLLGRNDSSSAIIVRLRKKYNNISKDWEMLPYIEGATTRQRWDYHTEKDMETPRFETASLMSVKYSCR
jgi:hypothetical protein